MPGDEWLGRTGRVMEMLSEHLCEGWLEGYLLTGRHGLFNCYEAFIHIVDSMVNQHAKYLKVCAELPWRADIACRSTSCSPACLAPGPTTASRTRIRAFSTTSSTRRRASPASTCRLDANCLPSDADHCLRSRNYVNVVVAGKHPSPPSG